MKNEVGNWISTQFCKYDDVGIMKNWDYCFLNNSFNVTKLIGLINDWDSPLNDCLTLKNYITE